METHGIADARLIVAGHSAGGQLALWAAGRCAPDAVVSLAGVADMALAARLGIGERAVSELLGGSRTQHPERYAYASPMNRLPLGVPQVLVHGSEDARVPLSISRAYRDAAAAAGDDVELFELPGADHASLIDPRTDDGRFAIRQICRLAGATTELT
jgi:dipeptidyl aminopeptidase/acylaminoacyl peptidase